MRGSLANILNSRDSLKFKRTISVTKSTVNCFNHEIHNYMYVIIVLGSELCINCNTFRSVKCKKRIIYSYLAAIVCTSVFSILLNY